MGISGNHATNHNYPVRFFYWDEYTSTWAVAREVYLALRIHENWEGVASMAVLLCQASQHLSITMLCSYHLVLVARSPGTRARLVIAYSRVRSQRHSGYSHLLPILSHHIFIRANILVRFRAVASLGKNDSAKPCSTLSWKASRCPS